VVERSRELRQRARRERVDDYFYGPRRTLAPASAQVFRAHCFHVVAACHGQ
jgi:hypothetical protein